MSFRQALIRAHRWLTLGLGGLFLLTATTGSLLVFGTEVDRALNPRLYRVTPGPEVGLDRAWAAAQRAFPGRNLARISTPALPAAGGVYQIRLAGEPVTDVHVDPGTGAVLGAR